MFMYCNPDTIYFKFHNVPDWNVIRNMIDVSWGTIVGNLEDQKDLKDYINNAVTGDIDLSDYVTKELLESKHYLTEHQSLADYATKLYVDDKVKSIKIPDVNLSNYYTKLEVDKKIEGLSTPDIDLSAYAKKVELPTKLSELTNDSGYITTYTETDPIWNSEKTNYYTKTEINNKNYLTQHQSLADYVKTEALTTALTTYAKKTDIPSVPTKLSELTNDSGFITTYTETDPVWNSEKVNYYTKDEINGKNYLTEHQSLADYAKKSEIPTDYVRNTELTSYATKTYVTEQIGSINSVLENI